jgi:hypothetical protein
LLTGLGRTIASLLEPAREAAFYNLRADVRGLGDKGHRAILLEAEISGKPSQRRDDQSRRCVNGRGVVANEGQHNEGPRSSVNQERVILQAV